MIRRLHRMSKNLNHPYVHFLSACIIISFIITSLMLLLSIGSTSGGNA